MDSFPPYVSSIEDGLTIKDRFQIHEGVSYVSRSKTKAKCKDNGGNIHFVDKYNVVTNNEYPFSIVCTHVYECMYGMERHAARKQKLAEEKEKQLREDHPLPSKRMYRKCQASKKKGCPARLIMKEVVMYTDYKFDGPQPTDWERKRISRDLHAAMEKGDINKEVRVYMKYPEAEDHHSVHELGKNALAIVKGVNPSFLGDKAVSMRAYVQGQLLKKSQSPKRQQRVCDMVACAFSHQREISDDPWVRCDSCGRWLHITCVDLRKQPSADKDYICPVCHAQCH